MNVRDLLPLLIYDDSCYHCSKFASIVKSLAGKNILIVGHNTESGKEIKSEIFPKDYDATRMFWFVTDKIAYGGRAGILPLIFAILKRRSRKTPLKDMPLIYGDDCKTTKAFFMRVRTLLSNSQKIPLG
ncbi:MAG: hypothetical protein KGH89_07520 [Thaumarchaeota archaeon]|nr:hypothetical protein [Nitrososphaerota archaeon]MDE1866935.1 hypothetical protein [Nitrososphaerota archaeon]